MAPAEPAALRVELCQSPAPRQVSRLLLELPAGSTVADALRAGGLDAATVAAQGLVLAVWGRAADAAIPLRDQDRVEVLRPLLVDPKEARRQRYRRQGGPKRGRPAAAPR